MRVRLGSAGVALLFLTLSAMSVEGNLASLIPPPAGAKVAIVVFEDLEWPDCATAQPVLASAATAHNIPLVIHDFPLPRHTWSFQAAVNARFFQSQQQKLGDEFRGYILQNQKLISDEAALQQFTAKFAQDKQVSLPALLDPDGKLAEAVTADFHLGQLIGVEHTPTVFVVSGSAAAIPFVETIDRHKLDRAIDELEKKAGPAGEAKPPGKKR